MNDGGSCIPSDIDDSGIVGGSSLWRPLMLLAIIILCLGIVYATPLHDLFYGSGLRGLEDWVQGFGAWAPATFVLLNIVAVALGVPRLAFAMMAGALFGWLEGMVLNQTATVIACWLTFMGGRMLGRAYVSRRVKTRFPRTGALLEMMGRRGVMVNVIIRTAPVGNCFAVNLLMSLSPITQGDFLIGTFLGILPGTVIYALFGSAAGGQPVLRLLGGGLLLLILTVIHAIRHRRIGTAPQPMTNGSGQTP